MDTFYDKMKETVASQTLSIEEGVVIEQVRFPHLAGLSPEQLVALERRVRWKVDLRLLPTLVLIYIMNYLDRYGSARLWDYRRKLNSLLTRNTIAQAKLGGLEADLKLTGVQYQACVSIFFAG